jgi:4-amino-4-deoxy-L-arabinose transferase-like glycosyltransferase
MKGRHDGLLGLCLAGLLFSVYLLTFSGVYHSSDEISMLVATDSLARRGALDIELVRWMGEQQGSFGPDGHLYSRKGIGTTLATLPCYWLALQSEQLGNVQTAMLTNAAVTALTGLLLFLMLQRLNYGRGVALAAALAFGLGTMAWPYARYLFSESLAGLGLIASAYFLLRYRDQPGPARLLLAGAGLGMALLARLNNAIVAPFLGLVLLAYLYQQHGRQWRSYLRPVILFGLPVLAALVVTGWYNWARFGSPLTTGYLPQETFSTPFFEGLYGLLLSPGRGLFWYNPLLFAALLGWPAFFRQHRTEALLAGAVVLSNVAFYASWFLWWAGHAWGPRFLVTVLPFAALPLAAVFQAAARRRWIWAGLAALALASLAVQVLGVAVDFNLYLEDLYAALGLYHPATLFEPGHSPLLQQWRYLRPENLDLAWARGGTLNWPGLSLGLAAVTLSGLALGAAWHRRAKAWTGAGLVALLGLASLGCLLLYAPGGDTAQASHALAAMERQGEAAALTAPLLTEPFQDAYDGNLPVWGVPSREEVADPGEGLWTIGTEAAGPTSLRLQVGAVHLAFQPTGGTRFEPQRLPVPMLSAAMQLGQVVELVGFQLVEKPNTGRTPFQEAPRTGLVEKLEGSADIKAQNVNPRFLEGSRGTVRPGQALEVALYWRALAPMDTSYTVFLQAVDENGTKAGQVDRLPCDGGCLTTTWRPGDIVGEHYDLLIARDAAPGSYQLIAGMYDLATGEQLPLLDAQGRPAGTHLSLGTIQIQP